MSIEKYTIVPYLYSEFVLQFLDCLFPSFHPHNLAVVPALHFAGKEFNPLCIFLMSLDAVVGLNNALIKIVEIKYFNFKNCTLKYIFYETWNVSNIMFII